MKMYSIVAALMNIGYVMGQKMIISPETLDMSNVNAAGAYFTVRLDIAPDYDMIVNFTSTAVTFSSCQSLVFSVDNWQIDQKIYIDRQSVFSSLSVDMSSAEILTELINTETNKIVQNKTVSLRNIRPNQGANCYSTGDPHFVTFNNQRYDYQSYHTVWLLQSPFLSVQCLQMPCNNYVTCNIACSIQVSDGVNFAYFLTSANGTTANLATTKVRDDNNFLSSYLHHQVVSNRNWKFIFRDGSYVTLVGNTWPTADQGYMDVYIFVPTKYKFLTSGLCGVWDNNATSLMMPNGTSLQFIDKRKSASNVLLFTNSWTIQNSSVAYNQIYNVINGTAPAPMNFTTMYRFQPYVNNYVQQKCGSDLQTIIQTWSSNTFKQCMKPLKVMPTLVRTPTGLLNSKPFTINWNAIQRYNKWGKYTPVITDPLRYYPGYLFRGSFLKRREVTNEAVTEVTNEAVTEVTNEAVTEVTTEVTNEVPKEQEVSSQDLLLIEEQCKKAMVAENCQQIVPNEYLNHISNCVGDVKHVWFMTTDRDTSIATTLNNHMRAFLEHCKQASENFLALIPAPVAIKIDNILSQVVEETVTNNNLKRRSIDMLNELESIVGSASPVVTVIKAQMNNGFGTFQHMHICLNNGITLSSGGCECVDTFSGTHCENKLAIPPTTTSTSTDDSPSTTSTTTTTSTTSTSTDDSTSTTSTDDSTSSTLPTSSSTSTSNTPSNSAQSKTYSYILLSLLSSFYLFIYQL